MGWDFTLSLLLIKYAHLLCSYASTLSAGHQLAVFDGSAHAPAEIPEVGVHQAHITAAAIGDIFEHIDPASP